MKPENTPIDGEKTPIVGENTPIDGEKTPIVGETQKISPLVSMTYKPNFCYILLHILTGYLIHAPALRFGLRAGLKERPTGGRTARTTLSTLKTVLLKTFQETPEIPSMSCNYT